MWQAVGRPSPGRSTAAPFRERSLDAPVNAGTQSSLTHTRTRTTTFPSPRSPWSPTSAAIRTRGTRQDHGATPWIRTSDGSTATCLTAASFVSVSGYDLDKQKLLLLISLSLCVYPDVS